MPYLFEGYSLDPERRELRHGEQLVAVEPQVFDLLRFLVSNRSRVVSKDEVFDAVWHGRIVSESALSSRINAARSAVGDTGEAQRLIRTFRGKGLRFVGGVRETSLPQSPAASPRPLLVLGDRPSIAVLPFTNMSGDPEQEYFADGTTEDIITALSRVRRLVVVARNSTFQFKHVSPDVRHVASTLGVRYVVEGSVRKAGERVRITAQLVDGSTGNHLWAHRFDRKLNDIFAIQDEITCAIVGQIEPELDRAEYERARATPPESLGAWDLFHRGMMLIAQRTKKGNALARHLLESSLTLDPGFAPAHAAIAWSQAEDLFFRYAAHDPKEVLGRARRAVTLDDRDALSHFALAWALTFDRQPDRAIEEVTRALEINPSYARAHAILGRLLVHSGRCQEGLEHVEMALRLSPSDPSAAQFRSIIAVARLYLGEDRKAIEAARQVMQVFDTWPARMIVAAALGHLGDLAAAEQARRDVEQLFPGFSIRRVRHDYVVFHQPYLERLLSGLRKAGVPEE